MIALACAAASAVAFWFSIGLGAQWWLLWLAPVPVLWLAFGEARFWTAAVVAFTAAALGGSNIALPYAGLLLAPVLALAIAGPALAFAAAVLGARRVQRSLGPLAGLVAFASLWTMFDFMTSFNGAGGTVSTPAAAEVAVPVLIQSAALVSYVGVTFIVGAVAAGLALALRTRRPVFVAIAVGLFALNAAFGAVRLATPPAKTMRVALVESDAAVGTLHRFDKASALAAIDAYSAQFGKLKGDHVALVVLPENIAQLDPAWRGEAYATLQAAADDLGATIVAGFGTPMDGAGRNVSLSFVPHGGAPAVYEKRRLVPGLETSVYTPGPGPRALPGGVGLEICKDMDFQAMLRTDTVATHPLLLAVPAWDFGADGWAHARVAVFRSVENGVPMARAARDGLLTLNDRYGRVLAQAKTQDGFTTLTGDLPLAGASGFTVYDRIGDVFGWLSAALGLGLFGAALLRGVN